MPTKADIEIAREALSRIERLGVGLGVGAIGAIIALKVIVDSAEEKLVRDLSKKVTTPQYEGVYGKPPSDPISHYYTRK